MLFDCSFEINFVPLFCCWFILSFLWYHLNSSFFFWILPLIILWILYFSYFFSFILFFEDVIEDVTFEWRSYFLKMLLLLFLEILLFLLLFLAFEYFVAFHFLDYFLFWKSLFAYFPFSIFILIPNIVAFYVILWLLWFCTFITVECFIFVLLIIFHSPLIWTYKFDRCYNILSPNVRLWGF